MDWSRDRSLKIAKMAVLAFTLIMVAVMLTAPKIFGALIERRINYLYGKLPLFLRLAACDRGNDMLGLREQLHEKDLLQKHI